MCEFEDCHFVWVAEVDWAEEIGGIVHHGDDPSEKIFYEAEGSSLLALAVNSDVLVLEGLEDEKECEILEREFGFSSNNPFGNRASHDLIRSSSRLASNRDEPCKEKHC